MVSAKPPIHPIMTFLAVAGFSAFILVIAWAMKVDVDRQNARYSHGVEAENAALQHENAWLIKQLELCGCGES